jgi:hypothetical protein
MKRPEQEIQKAVVQHLNRRAESGVFFFHVPNGGKKSPQVGAIYKALGVVAGVPDIIILKGGRLYALELKAPGGRLSPSQRLVGARMEECGAEISVAHSIDEALVTLEYWNILKRNRAFDISGSEILEETA